MPKSKSRRHIFVRGHRLTVGNVKDAMEQFFNNRPYAMHHIVSALYETDREGLDMMVTIIANSLSVPKDLVWQDLRKLVYQ